MVFNLSNYDLIINYSVILMNIYNEILTNKLYDT
jgi:hypothetical protein